MKRTNKRTNTNEKKTRENEREREQKNWADVDAKTEAHTQFRALTSNKYYE